jgi:hypothetical protein
MNEQTTKDTKQFVANRVCETCVQDPEAPRTMYVHLTSGKVTEVTGVTEIEVTLDKVVLRREGELPAVFTRRDVYFACCDANEQPSF